MALDGSQRPPSFQEIILRLQSYWADQGCVILQPYDLEVGAGTFHTATTLRAWSGNLECSLCAAVPSPDRWSLRREPQPPAALLPVPGADEAVTIQFAGFVSWVAQASGH